MTATLDSKIYDGTNSASGRLILNGLFGSDVLSITSNAPTFNDARVGTNKTVSFGGLTLIGNAQTLANYLLPEPVSFASSIAPMLPDAAKTMAIAGMERFAGYVTFKAPVLAFVPLFLSAPNVGFNLDDQKTSEQQEKPAPLVLSPIVVRSVWSVDVADSGWYRDIPSQGLKVSYR
jgi:hypothetical protein